MFSPSAWTMVGRRSDATRQRGSIPAPAREAAVTIRRARQDDQVPLARLAALDAARPLHGEALLAEVGGTPVAALEMSSGRAVADPFAPTAQAVALLRLRADQLAHR